MLEELTINNFDDIRNLLTFLLRGKIYAIDDVEEIMKIIYSDDLMTELLHFKAYVIFRYPQVTKKIKESISLTKRVYSIHSKFPTDFFINNLKYSLEFLIGTLANFYQRIKKYKDKHKINEKLLRDNLNKILIYTIELSYISTTIKN